MIDLYKEWVSTMADIVYCWMETKIHLQIKQENPLLLSDILTQDKILDLEKL